MCSAAGCGIWSTWSPADSTPLPQRGVELVTLPVGLGFAAGFWAGNGLPHYVAGSTGDSTGPGPFRPSATADVLCGWMMLAAAAVCRPFADTATHPVPAYAAAAVGVLLVGLVHARLWRAGCWGRARSASVPGA